MTMNYEVGMGEANETNAPKAGAGQRSEGGRMRFGMRTMLLVPILLIVFVGLAEVVDLKAFHISYRLFGLGWPGNTRHWLIGAGVPASFVTGYVSLALLHLPGWVVLTVMMFVLGLRRSRRAHFLAWLLALAFPLSEIIGDSWFAASGLFPEVNALFNFNIRIVSAFGFVVGIGGWFFGWVIRGRHYDRAVDGLPAWISRSAQIAIWTLVLIASAYGWTSLASLRELTPSLAQ